MAAPVTHIVLAHKVFDKFFSDKSPKEFFVGTSFPDIRYLGVIDRDQTHIKDFDFEKINKLNSFDAGLRIHNFVDIKREEFLRSKNIYSKLPESPFLTQAMKFYEDILLYDKLKDWQEIANYFTEISSEELKFGIAESDVQIWHDYLKSYFLEGPISGKILAFIRLIKRPEEMASEITKTIELLRSIPEYQNVVYELYDNFVELLRS